MVGVMATLLATASDDVGVVGVQFMVNGEPLSDEDTTAPYELEWNTWYAEHVAHTITAVARDAMGHETTASVTVTVWHDHP